MVQSNVTFNSEDHSYMLEGIELTSVTTLIKKYILPDMYKGVDENLLSRKAEYGTEIHKRIEMIESGFPCEDNADYPDIVAYEEWKKQFYWPVGVSEYLVSDGECIAGTIDQVIVNDEEISICDIKTTSVLHMEYLQWQLSLYAYLFEKQNKDKKVAKLFALHINGGKCELVEIERIPQHAIDALIECVKSGAEEFVNPLKQTCIEAELLIEEYRKVIGEKADYDAVVKALDARKKELESAFVELCKQRGQTEFQTSQAVVKKKADTIRKTFNMDKFQESAVPFIQKYCPKGTSKAALKKQDEFMGLWEQALQGGYKESLVNGGVTIKFV